MHGTALSNSRDRKPDGAQQRCAAFVPLPPAGEKWSRHPSPRSARCSAGIHLHERIMPLNRRAAHAGMHQDHAQPRSMAAGDEPVCLVRLQMIDQGANPKARIAAPRKPHVSAGPYTAVRRTLSHTLGREGRKVERNEEGIRKVFRLFLSGTPSPPPSSLKTT
jgi:hypothetical protein